MEHTAPVSHESQCRAELAALRQEFTEFAYAVSHDLNAALRESICFTRLLQEKYGSGMENQAQQYLIHIMQGNNRAQAMLEGLLFYSRIDTQAEEIKDDVDSAQSLVHSIETLKAAIYATNADIQVAQLPAVRADGKQLTQLFTCLLSNSLKFISPGQKPCITVVGTEIGKGWRFHIRDNGIGIAIKDFEEVFKPLRQLHRAGEYPGVGMGLAVARKIVQRHGGRIWVEPEVGKGISVWFTLAKKSGQNREAA